MASGKTSGRTAAELLAGYWRTSTQPIICLAFVAPMLLAYEGGLLLWPRAMRNGADVWLRKLLELAATLWGLFFARHLSPPRLNATV